MTRRRKVERFIWVRSAPGHLPGEMLHAVAEEQIATQQDAHCGKDPGVGRWSRADRVDLAEVPSRKCPDCVRLTSDLVDESLRGIRWMEKLE